MATGDRAGLEPGARDADAVTNAVMTASRLLVAVSARSLAAVQDQVTLPQFRLLVMLEQRGPGKLVGLAQQLGVNPSTATRMIDRLYASGFVDRQANPGNRRENLLALTEAGHRIVSEVTARRRAEIDAIVSRMEPGQRSALVEALTAFSEASEDAPVRTHGRDLYPLGWSETPPVET
ncbi:MarR family transcriptional regulator [Streptomyces diacarni]|uniref:MarR family transcriptional regulator n=1 Tax=Streptomyces diacarni TaxID=2800381 RepID=A0A367EZN7_9ACTN|nr:MarR family transcriptional regulator [Streptomyces diacarni]RCG23584.1 MarR family transcriptional regulator [Streptomyces diacarni]